eukprot:SAG31_NODE_12443_length_942_cov_0.976275_1_plen_73_part_00
MRPPDSAPVSVVVLQALVFIGTVTFGRAKACDLLNTTVSTNGSLPVGGECLPCTLSLSLHVLGADGMRAMYW